MAEEYKTPGQRAYEEDCRRQPCYPMLSFKKPRPTWEELPYWVRMNWEKYPTPREWKSRERE